mgnify:CR=1 FL=1
MQLEKEKALRGDVWCYSSHHRIVYSYPLKSVYHALSIYRNASPVGKISSREFENDRVQISRHTDNIRLVTIWHTYEVDLDLREIDHVYNQVVLALKATLEDCTYAEKMAFLARYIGREYGSDTGDVQILTTAEIAQKIGKSRRTIERWIHDIRDEFEDELRKRCLLPPKDLN